jgi:hypothetical protein
LICHAIYKSRKEYDGECFFGWTTNDIGLLVIWIKDPDELRIVLGFATINGDRLA